MDSEMFGKDENNNPVSLKIIMIGKEVGSIIGRNGDIIKRFREESGAKINISSGSYAERVITVSGNTAAIMKAFAFICDKIEEFQSSQNTTSESNNLNQQQPLPNRIVSGGASPVITVKLVVPAYQCGSLIGKGGSKIKGIRQTTGATIQVATDMLPNSTERAVIVSGTKQSVLQCIGNICSIMQESPRKTLSIPYQPKNYLLPPMLVSTNASQPYEAYAMWQGLASAAAASAVANTQNPTTDGAAILSPGCGSTLGVPYSLFVPSGMGVSPLTVFDPIFKNGHIPAAIPHIYPTTVPDIGRIGAPLSSLTAVDIGIPSPVPSNLNATALAAMTNRVQNTVTQTYEMTVPNDLIGCIIGKGGNKIAEIRQISGATIRISNCEDRENFENVERTITITGCLDSILVAQYLITASLEQQKLNVVRQNLSSANTSVTSVGNTIVNGPPGILPQSDITPSVPQLIHPLIPMTTNTTTSTTTAEYLPIPTALLPKSLNGNTSYNNVAAAIFAAHNMNSVHGTTAFGNLQSASQFFFHNPNPNHIVRNSTHSNNNNNNINNNNVNNNNINNLTIPNLTSAACSGQLFIKQQQPVAIKPQHQQQQQQQQQQQSGQEKTSNLFRMTDIKFRPY